jgi:hypothetical protein
MCRTTSRVMWSYRVITLILCLAWGITQTSAQDADSPKTASQSLVVPTAPAETLRWFSQHWDNTTWTAARNSMRPAGDRGWQVRMLALQSLVKSDAVAIPVLLKALKGEDVAQRILAAQALSFLSPQVPHQAIVDAAKNDSNAAVRLYAADTLGMQGNVDSAQLLKQLHKNETNRDVRWHLRYALERGSHTVSQAMVQKLRAWDPARLASATIGEFAPNFKLQNLTGQQISLNSFRGKQAVVLVFIYGDT